MDPFHSKENSAQSMNSSSEELKLMSKEGKLLQEEEMKPMIDLKRQKNYENANIFSLLFFNWSEHAIKLSNTQGLKISDVGELQKTQKT